MDEWIHPTMPRRTWPRKVRYDIYGAATVGLAGQVLIGYSGRGRKEVIPGMVADAIGFSSGSWASAAAALSGVAYTRWDKSATTSQFQGHVRSGQWALHGYMDPDGPPIPWNLVAYDKIAFTGSTAEESDAYFGWFNANTLADRTTVVGVYWTCNYDGADEGKWTAKVRTGTGTATEVFSAESDRSGDVNNTALGIVLDGLNRQVHFYANDVLVGTYSPSSAPGEMAGGALGSLGGLIFGHSVIIQANGDCDLFTYGAGHPRLLTMLEA